MDNINHIAFVSLYAAHRRAQPPVSGAARD